VTKNTLADACAKNVVRGAAVQQTRRYSHGRRAHLAESALALAHTAVSGLLDKTTKHYHSTAAVATSLYM
jgi:hypothetical protein